jgi:hypothetical protein
MARYTGNYQGVTLSASAQDLKTLVTTATGQGSVLRLIEIYIAGEAGSSTVARMAVNRPSAIGVTIGANTQVPEKVDPASVAAAFSLAGSATAVSSWTTRPVLTTNDVLGPALNAFGGVIRWVAPPDSEVVVGSQGAVANLCIVSRSGTPAVTGHIIIEER